MPALPRRTVLGLPFIDARSVHEVVDEILATSSGDFGSRLSLVVTPNVDHLVRLDRETDSVLRDSTLRAAFVLPDGQPIVWASRILGEPLTARLTGSDLFPVLWARIRDTGSGVLVVAPSSQVADALRAENPSAHFVVPPVFDVEDRHAILDITATCIEVTASDPPAHVIVCISQPKQQLLALALLDSWPDSARPPVVACLGAAAEMHVGIERRAPRWVQRAGLEWMFRFVHNPRRLFRRYFVDDTRFVTIVAQAWWRTRRGATPADG